MEKCRKRASVVWGSPEYLKLRYGEIDEVRKLSRNAKAVKRIKAAIREISTDRDRLAVWEVLEASGTDATGHYRQYIVHVTLGLNGDGKANPYARQSDYFAALGRLSDTLLFHVFDAYVDAVDDVASVLCTVPYGLVRFRPDTDADTLPDKPGNADHRKQRGRTAPNAPRRPLPAR